MSGPAPETPARPGRRAAWPALAALMVGYALIFAAYYPPVAGVEDEIGFINQALIWSRGGLSSEGAGLPYPPHDFFPWQGRHVPARHPGRSLVALPFLAAGGVRATFASGLFIHLGMTLAGAALLPKLGRSPLWAVLLLFHPTLAVYSRTVMADEAAGAALLAAALAVACEAPVAAGLAAGAAAAFRYHSALALPLAAATFVYPPARPDVDFKIRLRDAARCLVAGAAVGAWIVAYNFAVYGRWNEPFTKERGEFSPSYLLAQTAFYSTALAVVWPGMVLAPLLDRSRLRWLTRGVIAVFLGPLLCYYFHDRAPGWLETAILGQRLLQVALPLWVVAYAGVLDDWLAAPLRRLLGGKVWNLAAAAACLALLGSWGVASHRHQGRLNDLVALRDALRADVPEGSLVMYRGPVFKLAMRPDGTQAYRLRPLETVEDVPVEYPPGVVADLDREPRPWFLVAIDKSPDPPRSVYFRRLLVRYRMKPVATGRPDLAVYAAPPGVPFEENTP